MDVKTNEDHQHKAWRFRLMDTEKNVETYRSPAVYTSRHDANCAGLDARTLYGQGIRDAKPETAGRALHL